MVSSYYGSLYPRGLPSTPLVVRSARGYRSYQYYFWVKTELFTGGQNSSFCGGYDSTTESLGNLLKFPKTPAVEGHEPPYECFKIVLYALFGNVPQGIMRADNISASAV